MRKGLVRPGSTDAKFTSFVGGRAVTPRRVLHDATVVTENGRILEVGQVAPRGDCVDVAGRWLLPGFIDLHVHGGGGASFNSDSPADVDAGVAFHNAHGTTRLLASLVSESVTNIRASLHASADSQAYRSGMLLGVHLEGPFLSHDRPGCHDLVHLLPPDERVLNVLLDEVHGIVKTMTIAPELPGALDLIRRLVESGVAVGIGHSTATLDQARAAFQAGAGFVTHVFNAMPGLGHRRPGILGAAIEEGAALELIADGIHVHPTVVAMTFALAGDQVALITDAAPAAGMPAGHLSYVGSAPVVTRADGRITRRDGDVLAGSALTLDQALRTALRAGVDLITATRALSVVPARILGEGDRFGGIAPGRRADLVVMDDDFHPLEVYVDGQQVATTEETEPAA